MEALNTVLKEIRRGENLELYLTIILAITVAILGILQIAKFEVISAVILATLGLLASSLLSSRRVITDVKASFDELNAAVKALETQGVGHISELLTRSYPDFTEQIRTAKRVSIEGSTLMSTVTRYAGEFARLLQRGGTLRILVSEPVPEVLAMQVFRSSSLKDPTEMKKLMEGNVAVMKALADKASSPDQFEIRVMPYLAPYSLVIIEGDDDISRAYVKLLPFQRPEPESPTFEVHSQYDGEWFQFFLDQFERMWAQSRKV